MEENNNEEFPRIPVIKRLNKNLVLATIPHQKFEYVESPPRLPTTNDEISGFVLLNAVGRWGYVEKSDGKTYLNIKRTAHIILGNRNFVLASKQNANLLACILIEGTILSKQLNPWSGSRYESFSEDVILGPDYKYFEVVSDIFVRVRRGKYEPVIEVKDARGLVRTLPLSDAASCAAIEKIRSGSSTLIGREISIKVEDGVASVKEV